VGAQDPSIRMLRLEHLIDGLPRFLVDIIRIKDSSFFPIHQISNISLQHLLMEGLGLLLGRGASLLERQFSLHGI
jgi:hypothetical protein